MVGLGDSDSSPSSPGTSSLCAEYEERLPPEAILPEEMVDEVPVHDSEGK